MQHDPQHETILEKLGANLVAIHLGLDELPAALERIVTDGEDSAPQDLIDTAAPALWFITEGVRGALSTIQALPNEITDQLSQLRRQPWVMALRRTLYRAKEWPGVEFDPLPGLAVPSDYSGLADIPEDRIIAPTCEWIERKAGIRSFIDDLMSIDGCLIYSDRDNAKKNADVVGARAGPPKNFSRSFAT